MSNNAGPSFTVPLYDTTSLTSALANPYAQHMSPHYYQAYIKACSNPSRTTPDGYTLSSTYIPSIPSQTRRETATSQPSMQSQSQQILRPIPNHLTYGSWYQPGNARCTRHGCPFTGSRKSVEIHMMDRHFIFPLGWEKKNDWDADPSLRGKPITIQGTSLVLDTPEAIDAWIAERKRRFPTDEKIQIKKRKLEEAVARGELTPEEIGARARKKYRVTKTVTDHGKKGFGGQGQQTSRARRLGDSAYCEEPCPENVVVSTSQPTDGTTKCTRKASSDSASTAVNDEAPESMSSKIQPRSICTQKLEPGHDGQAKTHSYSPKFPKKISQPKRLPRNPFVSRSTLLRNLLLPEIQVTVSNLSQAVRFLVDNDFLRGVELLPGEAQEQMIEVLGSSESLRPSCSPLHKGCS